MNYSYIKNSNEKRFNAVMKRECITVSDYYDTTKTYDIFFRRNNKGTNPQGKLRIYYAQDTDLSIGTIFLLNNKPYLVINQDAIESNVFCSSMAVKCDLTILTYSKELNKYITVPFALDVNDDTTSSNNTISIVDGYATIYTGLNQYSKTFNINDNYYCFGGYYKIGNLFYNNGLAYIYMTRETMPTEDTYLLIYNGLTSFDMADSTTYQLSYTAVKNNEIVDSPALTYASSDNAVATVDDTGLMTMLKEGNVTITATWTDGNNTTCPTTIAISNSGTTEPITGTLTLSGRNDVKMGFYRTINAIYSDAEGNNISSNYDTVFTITDADFDTSLLEFTDNGNSVVIYFDTTKLLNKTFTLNAVDSEGLFTPASMSIKLIDAV